MDSSTALARGRVLVVEDDDAVRRSLHLMLTASGFDVRTFGSAEAALDADAFAGASGAVLDYRLPGADGIQLLQRARAAGWHGRAVLITGVAPLEAARTCGFDAVLGKPLRGHELLTALAG